MKSYEQQIEDLRRWADMAELTTEQLSCLTPGQLREVAKSLEVLLSLLPAQSFGLTSIPRPQEVNGYVYHFAAQAKAGEGNWCGLVTLEQRVSGPHDWDRVKLVIGNAFNTVITTIESLSYLGREHE